MEHNNTLPLATCIPYSTIKINTMINLHCKLSCSDDHMLVDFNGDHNHHTDK